MNSKALKKHEKNAKKYTVEKKINLKIVLFYYFYKFFALLKILREKTRSAEFTKSTFLQCEYKICM